MEQMSTIILNGCTFVGLCTSLSLSCTDGGGRGEDAIREGGVEDSEDGSK